MTPSDHRSTAAPYFSPRRISGATYEGVPHDVERPRVPAGRGFANPMSAILMVLVASSEEESRIFSGFRSLHRYRRRSKINSSTTSETVCVQFTRSSIKNKNENATRIILNRQIMRLAVCTAHTDVRAIHQPHITINTDKNCALTDARCSCRACTRRPLRSCAPRPALPARCSASARQCGRTARRLRWEVRSVGAQRMKHCDRRYMGAQSIATDDSTWERKAR